MTQLTITQARRGPGRTGAELNARASFDDVAA